MAITYYMLQIPPYLLFILMVSFCGILSGMLTSGFRKNRKIQILAAHNEVTGFMFLAIASFYALLLSFVVLVVWDQLNETRSNVSKEGSSAMGLYRDIKFYPDTTESKLLMAAYLDFVYNVVDEEFPKMESMQTSPKTTESFNRVFYKMEHLNPKSPFQIQIVAEMFSHLNTLASYRDLRIETAKTEIPSPMWMPMILGALITLLCAMLLDIESRRMHVLLNSMLGVFIAIFLFTIITLDHPYTGKHGIKPDSYREIFTLEKLSNNKH